jgi:hypothetical protein
MTDIVSNRITGRVVRKSSELRGNATIAGYSIPMDRLKLANENREGGDDMFTAMLDSKQYKEDREPLEIAIFDRGDHFSGTLSRPSADFGMIGFHMQDADSYDAKRAKKNHSQAKEWEEHPASFSVPNKGIPTDSAPRRMIRLTKNHPAVTEADR